MQRPGRTGRIGGVLAFALMAALGAPFKWSKQRGGLVTEWIGLTTDYKTYVLHGPFAEESRLDH